MRPQAWYTAVLEPSTKIRDVIRLIEEDGWYLVATKGSHRQYRHQTKPGRVTFACQLSDDLAQGTLNSVLKQAQLRRPEKGKGDQRQCAAFWG